MDDDIVRDFLVESNENLDLLDRELIHLEKDPKNSATLASIFRTIHTIKGTCGFLGFTKLESVAHVGENLLSKLRESELDLSPEITTTLLQMVDAIRQMLASIESQGNEGERNDQELIKTLTRLHQGPINGNPTGEHAAPVDTAKTRERETAAAPATPVPELQATASVPEAPVKMETPIAAAFVVTAPFTSRIDWRVTVIPSEAAWADTIATFPVTMTTP